MNSQQKMLWMLHKVCPQHIYTHIEAMLIQVQVPMWAGGHLVLQHYRPLVSPFRAPRRWDTVVVPTNRSFTAVVQAGPAQFIISWGAPLWLAGLSLGEGHKYPKELPGFRRMQQSPFRYHCSCASWWIQDWALNIHVCPIMVCGWADSCLNDQ